MSNTNTGSENTGNRNSGDWNSGDWNSGNRNSGNRNSGDWNSGDWNSGNRNSGNRNSGDWNSGNGNSGNGNSGYNNSGNGNSGNGNSGNGNSGYNNSGNGNSGNGNSGYNNSGDWNSTSMETGFFNTTESETVRVFNVSTNKEEWINSTKPAFLYFELNEWVCSNQMTDEEKEENQSHIDAGGYLKKYDYKEAFQKSFNERKEGDLELLKALPNFDAEVFKEISGIDIYQEDEKAKEIESIREDMKKLTERLKELER